MPRRTRTPLATTNIQRYNLSLDSVKRQGMCTSASGPAAKQSAGVLLMLRGIMEIYT
jgi:hypothetical protein